MKADALHVIEAMYDVESDETTWLARLAEVAHAALDSGRGVIANVYDVSSPGPIRVEAASTGLRPGFFEFFMKSSEQLGEEYLRRAYLSSTACSLTSQFGGWYDLPFVRSGELAQWDIADDLVVRGWEPGGRGVTLNFFQPRPSRLSSTRRAHLSRIASHLGAAYRLRRRLGYRTSVEEGAEAILDAKGALHHAAGAAHGAQARERLKQAVAEMEHARGSLRGEDPTAAVKQWKALVAARWTLVDEFQEGSRRYIVAYINELDNRGPDVLTDRERQVATFAAAGHWTKLIAYHLGIADSTVRVLLSRAMSKLGAHSREELARIVSQWPVPPSRTPAVQGRRRGEPP
jgi:DNA-binding CsgD family transcriptional regulator